MDERDLYRQPRPERQPHQARQTRPARSQRPLFGRGRLPDRDGLAAANLELSGASDVAELLDDLPGCDPDSPEVRQGNAALADAARRDSSRHPRARRRTHA